LKPPGYQAPFSSGSGGVNVHRPTSPRPNIGHTTRSRGRAEAVPRTQPPSQPPPTRAPPRPGGHTKVEEEEEEDHTRERGENASLFPPLHLSHPLDYRRRRRRRCRRCCRRYRRRRRRHCRRAEPSEAIRSLNLPAPARPRRSGARLQFEKAHFETGFSLDMRKG
jgi:hypothetical protein